MSSDEDHPTREADCLSCRIIGATTMLGVSAYGMVTRAQTPTSQRGNRMFLLGVSGFFAVAGVARAFWPDDDRPQTAGDSVYAIRNPQGTKIQRSDNGIAPQLTPSQRPSSSTRRAD